MISDLKFQISEKGNKSHCRTALLLWTCMFFLLAVPSAFANVLGNSDFSQPLGSGTASNWQTNDAPPVVPSRVTSAPAGFTALPGSGALQMDTNGQFVWQEYNNVKPGDVVTFSATAEASLLGGAFAYLKIEFKNNDSNTPISEIKPGETIASNLYRITKVSAPDGGGYNT